MRFFFLKRVSPKPSGGHKHIRLVASCLNNLGVPSQLVFPDQARDRDWSFGIEVPVAPFEIGTGSGFVGPDDIAVMPESYLQGYLRAVRSWPCRKAVLIQNGYYALHSRPRGGYARQGIDFAIVNSPYIASLTRAVLGLPPSRILTVPCWVDRAPFLASAEQPGRSPHSVCYMPRKLPDRAEKIRAAVARTMPDTQWESIDGAGEEAVAAAFRRCAVFLSTQDREGFGLPAIEAMNCGCVVAGYGGTGRFPHPYASAENGLWAPDRSVGPAAARVCEALTLVRRGGAELQRIVSAGQKTAGAYSAGAFEDAVARLAGAAAKNSFDASSTHFVQLGLGGWLEIAKTLGGRWIGLDQAGARRRRTRRP